MKYILILLTMISFAFGQDTDTELYQASPDVIDTSEMDKAYKRMLSDEEVFMMVLPLKVATNTGWTWNYYISEQRDTTVTIREVINGRYTGWVEYRTARDLKKLEENK